MSAAPAAARGELEVDHLHPVAGEEHVVGPDVTVQQHVDVRSARPAPAVARSANRSANRATRGRHRLAGSGRGRPASPARTPGSTDRARSACRCSESASRQADSPGRIDQACSPASCSTQIRARSIDRPARWSAFSQSCEVLQQQHEVDRVRRPSGRRTPAASPSVRVRRRAGRTPVRAGSRRAFPSRRAPRDCAGSFDDHRLAGRAGCRSAARGTAATRSRCPGRSARRERR